MAPSPLLQLFPAPAQPDLTNARFGALGLGRVARRVVGVADDILSQGVNAVEHVAPAPRLRPMLPEFHQGDVDRSLSCHVSTIRDSDWADTIKKRLA